MDLVSSTPGPDLALLPKQEGQDVISARLALVIRTCDGYLEAALCGELDAVNAAAVGAALTRAVEGSPRVAIDLTGLEFIDCCGLGVLASVREQAQRAGGDMLLAAPGSQVRRLLALIAMTPGFTVAATMTEAAESAGWVQPATVKPSVAR